MKTLVLIVNRLAWFVPTVLGLLAIVFFIFQKRIMNTTEGAVKG